MLDPQLTSFSRFSDVSLLALRLMTGIFLVYGVADNIASSARMAEFVGFLAHHGFPAPAFAAPLTVYTQLAFGLCMIAGIFTRLAGLGCALTFVVALAMVHLHEDLRGWWPALALVGIGLVLATEGAGRFSVDARLMRRRAASA